MRKHVTALLLMLMSISQSVAEPAPNLSKQVADAGYVPVALLSEALHHCETIASDQMDQCGYILLTALQTAMKFKTAHIPDPDVIVTKTDRIAVGAPCHKTPYSAKDGAVAIRDIDVSLEILLAENRRLRDRLARATRQ